MKTRRKLKCDLSSTSNLTSQESESVNKKLSKRSQRKALITEDDEGSSSDSSIGEYLKPADKIDLNSSFFKIGEKNDNYEDIEKSILGNVNTLSDSDESDLEFKMMQADNKIREIQSDKNYESTNISNDIMRFEQLEEYTKKLEDAKQKLSNFNSNLLIPEDKLDINQLLALGESTTEEISHNLSNSSNDSDSELEVVVEEKPRTSFSSIPKEGVQITLNVPITQKNKNKKDDIMMVLKRKINRVKKECQIYIHKVHLLCWLAHGNFLNSILNNPVLLGLALSLIPSQHCYPKDRTDLNYLEQITKWYAKLVKIKDKELNQTTLELPLLQSLKLQINRKEAFSKKDLVLIFTCMLRSLGIQCRLVLSFRVLPIRPPSTELCSLSAKITNKQNTSISKENLVSHNNTLRKNSDNIYKSQVKTVSNTENIKKRLLDQSEKRNDSLEKASLVNVNKKSKKTNQQEKMTKKQIVKSKKIPQLDGTNDSCTESEDNSKIKNPRRNQTPKNKSIRSRSCRHKKDVQYEEMNSDEDFQPTLTKRKKSKLSDKKDNISNEESTSKSESVKSLYFESTQKSPVKENQKKIRKALNLTDIKISRKNVKSSNSFNDKKVPSTSIKSDIIHILKNRIKEQKQSDQSKKNRVKGKLIYEDEDSDYAPEPVIKKKRNLKSNDSDDDFDFNKQHKMKTYAKQRRENDRRVLSTDDDNDEPSVKKGNKIGNDFWVEVYLEAEEKWISVDIIKGKVHCTQELFSRATQPVTYIMAWNNDNTLKDVTSRYCKNWNTVTRKLRVDSVWWNITLKPYIGKKTARDKEEDEDLARQQLDQPLPTTIGEYKNHPLYALKRHLLKFEAIYPPDAVTLGFVRNEAVYARECVYTLHSRETWVKQARVVKPGENPYKIVKARPKYDKLTGNTVTDIPLEVFGLWQTDEYVPPIAENGVVPRNAYGNVELFKPCMLPKGTVHLQLPGLNKIARKLGIDCAPAMIGFDYHSGGSHPAFDGYVICQEFKDTIVAAWEQEQEEAAKRTQEKIENRVYGNWKKLIKGLLIRERLKAKYGFGEPSFSDANKKKKAKRPRLLVKKQ